MIPRTPLSLCPKSSILTRFSLSEIIIGFLWETTGAKSSIFTRFFLVCL